jgi:hypothetical protein
LFSDLRKFFHRNNVLAQHSSEVQSHVVANFPINREAQMFAEFAVKNGAFHVTETLDVRSVSRQKLNETGAKALLMDQAQRSLGKDTHRYAIVAANSWAEAKPIFSTLNPYCENLINYHDSSDMRSYLLAIGNATHTVLEMPFVQ